MKAYLTNTINDISMITFFSDSKNIEKITFEKMCYTKENDNIQSHKFSLSLKKTKNENVLYSVEATFSSDKYDAKHFYLGFIEKEQKFKYFDNEKLKEVELTIPSGEPTLKEISEFPILSPIFRDFVIAYNKSSLKNPIDVYQVYMNRLHYPESYFEKLLYSFALRDNKLVTQIKSEYLKEKKLNEATIKKIDIKALHMR